MKRILLSLGIITILAVLSGASLWYLDSIHDEISVMLQECYLYGVEGNKEAASKKSQEVFEKWQESEKYLVTFIHHNELNEVTIVTSRLSPLIENGETAEYLAEVKQAVVLIEHMRSSEQPHWKNIL
ncbi:DUF4363 family protein [Zongyangia sp. HA2173]|uniref:DUF4363 family protein n=1 Tax=Zongyangia sp. HA2173 TaxID=3133035 RepID=UPI003164FF15